MRREDIIQALFLSLHRVDSPEESRVPFDIICFPHSRFLALAVFNLELFVGGAFLVAVVEGFDNVLPEALGLTFFLLGYRFYARWGILGVCGVEEEFLFVGLPHHQDSSVKAFKLLEEYVPSSSGQTSRHSSFPRFHREPLQYSRA